MSDILFDEEVLQVVGCAFEVLNGPDHSLKEKNYENALTVEFGLRRIGYRQQHRSRWLEGEKVEQGPKGRKGPK